MLPRILKNSSVRPSHCLSNCRLICFFDQNLNVITDEKLTVLQEAVDLF